MTNSGVVLNSESHREDSFIQTQGPGGVKSIFPVHQSSSHSTIETSTVIANTAIPANIMNSGGFVEFTLPKQRKKVSNITMEMTLANPTAAIVTLNRVFSAIEKIEYFAGSSFLGVIEDQALYLKYVMLHADTQLSNRSKYSNLSSGFSAYDSSLGIGEERTLYMDIGEMLIGIIPAFINQDLRLRVHFSKMLESLTSSENSIVVQSSKLLVENVNLTDGEASEIEKVYNSDKFTHRFFEARTQEIPITLNPGASYTLSLQNFYGSYGQLWIAVKKSSNNYTTKFEYLDEIDSVWVTDAGNKIAMGGNILKADYLKFNAGLSFPSSYLRNNHLLPLVASKSPYVDLKSGRHSGSLELTAKGEALHINTTSDTTASSSRSILIIGFHASALRVQKGNILVLR